MAYHASGIMAEELKNEPSLPELVRHIWTWFLELHQCRGSNGYGPNPIAWRDIADWVKVTGNRLVDWEVRAIRAIDVAYLDQQAKQK